MADDYGSFINNEDMRGAVDSGVEDQQFVLKALRDFLNGDIAAGDVLLGHAGSADSIGSIDVSLASSICSLHISQKLAEEITSDSTRLCEIAIDIMANIVLNGRENDLGGVSIEITQRIGELIPRTDDPFLLAAILRLFTNIIYRRAHHTFFMPLIHAFTDISNLIQMIVQSSLDNDLLAHAFRFINYCFTSWCYLPEEVRAAFTSSGWNPLLLCLYALSDEDTFELLLLGNVTGRLGIEWLSNTLESLTSSSSAGSNHHVSTGTSGDDDLLSILRQCLEKLCPPSSSSSLGSSIGYSLSFEVQLDFISVIYYIVSHFMDGAKELIKSRSSQSASEVVPVLQRYILSYVYDRELFVKVFELWEEALLRRSPVYVNTVAATFDVVLTALCVVAHDNTANNNYYDNTPTTNAEVGTDTADANTTANTTATAESASSDSQVHAPSMITDTSETSHSMSSSSSSCSNSISTSSISSSSATSMSTSRGRSRRVLVLLADKIWSTQLRNLIELHLDDDVMQWMKRHWLSNGLVSSQRLREEDHVAGDYHDGDLASIPGTIQQHATIDIPDIPQQVQVQNLAVIAGDDEEEEEGKEGEQEETDTEDMRVTASALLQLYNILTRSTSDDSTTNATNGTTATTATAIAGSNKDGNAAATNSTSIAPTSRRSTFSIGRQDDADNDDDDDDDDDDVDNEDYNDALRRVEKLRVLESLRVVLEELEILPAAEDPSCR